MAMTDTYPIIELQTDWLLGDEQMGSKDKFWVRLTSDRNLWLFKYSRVSAGRITGEHWAEKIAAEVATVLGVPHARVELAVLDGHPGSLSQRFAQLARANANVELVHGNVLLAGYLVLDALILNTDRHHENWGVLRTTNRDQTVSYQIAPSFDHASSLARNEPPEKLGCWLLEKGRVEAYMQGAHGGIYREENLSRGANPYTIAAKAMQQWPEYFAYWQDVLDNVEQQAIDRVVDRVPDSVMAMEQKIFVKALLALTLNKLKNIREK